MIKFKRQIEFNQNHLIKSIRWFKSKNNLNIFNNLFSIFPREIILDNRQIVLKLIDSIPSPGLKYRLLQKKFEKKTKDQSSNQYPLLELEENSIFSFRPTPNSFMHLGHLRGLLTIYNYWKIGSNSRFILRFDDTDLNKTNSKIYIDDYLDIVKKIGFKIDKILYCSERLEIYWSYLKKFYRQGKIFKCQCSTKTISSLRFLKQPCQCRDKKLKKFNLLRWRTDLEVKDHSHFDWICYRKQKIEDKIYLRPTLKFQGAIDDILENCNPLFRGTDLQNTEVPQKMIFKCFNRDYPRSFYWGKIKIKDLDISSTRLNLKKGHKWSKPWVRTFLDLGFKIEDFKVFFRAIGLKSHDITIDLRALYKLKKFKKIDYNRAKLTGQLKELIYFKFLKDSLVTGQQLRKTKILRYFNRLVSTVSDGFWQIKRLRFIVLGPQVIFL